MIFLSASVWQILALGIDGFHTNQCIIMQQEFAREFGEISPTICSFGVQCASKLRNILGEIFLRGVSGGVGKRYFYDA